MSASKSTIRLCAVSVLLVLVAGCVVGDQLATFTIHSDGSADLVVFRSNLRSTDKGAKGRAELAEYKARFDARTEDELARVAQAGGTIVEASWVRQQVPLSNLLHAQFPNASALEKYLTIKDEQERLLVKTKFQSDGARRRLTVHVTVPPDKANPSPSPPTNVEQFRQANANGISETRIALAGGTITTAYGFAIADDKQSAVLDFSAIDEILRTGGKGELYLEWEVTP